LTSNINVARKPQNVLNVFRAGSSTGRAPRLHRSIYKLEKGR